MVIGMPGGKLVEHEVFALLPIVLQCTQCLDDSESKTVRVGPAEEVLVQGLVAQLPSTGPCKSGYMCPGTLLAEKVVENFPHMNVAVRLMLTSAHPYAPGRQLGVHAIISLSLL